MALVTVSARPDRNRGRTERGLETGNAMTAETDHIAYRAGMAGAKPARAKPAPREASGTLSRLLRPFRRLFGGFIFSSLTPPHPFPEPRCLGVLMSGILYINQFRDGLIDARVESLMTQGEIIAGAIAASANVETNAILIDPDKLLELQAGESIVPQCRPVRQSRFSHQSGKGRPGPAPADLADPHPRAHLRPRRQPAARFAPPLFRWPGSALRSAAGRQWRNGFSRLARQDCLACFPAP